MAKTKTVTKQTIQNEREPGGDIPESIMMYIAMHPDTFLEYLSHDTDTERIMKMSRKGIERSDAEQVAWLLWRARMVRTWTAHPTTRQPTLSWEAAVESAWLKDETFASCSARRKAFYAEREARRERLDGLVQTGALDVHCATKQERKNARAAKKAEKEFDEKHSTNNPDNATDPLPPVEDRLKEQATA